MPPTDSEQVKAMVSAASKDHSNNIDALRLVLALLVLYSHSYPLGSGSEVYEPLAMLSHGQSTLGGLAVTSFFILSGYLIAQSWDRSRDTRSFFIKRVRRIYPGYLVASAICVWLVVPIASEQGSAVYSWRALLDNSWRFLALRGFKIPPTFVTNPMPLAVNGSLWSIPFEFWCYIGTMVLGITQVIHRRRLMLGVFVASILTHFVVEYQQLTPGGKILGVIFGYPKFWARLLPCYLAGTLFYLYRDRVRLDWRCAVFSLVGILLATQVPHGLIFAIPTLVAYVLVYLSFTRDIRLPAVAARGDFSYGVYLYSFPIQQLILFFIGTTVAPITLFLLAVVPAVLAGVASWYLVERRFLRAKCRPSFPIDVHPERIEPNDHATYPTSPI